MKIILRSILLSLLFSLPLSAQDTVNVMAYNLLFYDQVPQVRDTCFRKVIAYTNPDILLVQEIDGQSPVSNFLHSVMNYYTPNLYTTTQYINGPNWDVAVYYKPSLFQLIQIFVLPTTGRNIMGYKFRHKKSEREFIAFGLHLKAGNSEVDRNRRLQEASVLRDFTNQLPLGTDFFVGGDFNFYGDWEPAYQTLTLFNLDTSGAFHDPYTLTGTWNNFSYRQYHSQSTRTRSFGGGSTGGLDDRFDFFMNSYSITQPGGIEYITNSLIPIGNDGNHYNDSINKRPNTAVPDSIADALHYGSDHLPVQIKYIFHPTVSIIKNVIVKPISFRILKIFPNPYNSQFYIDIISDVQDNYWLEMFDVRGALVRKLHLGNLNRGEHSFNIDNNSLNSGIYYLKLHNSTEHQFRKSILIK